MPLWKIVVLFILFLLAIGCFCASTGLIGLGELLRAFLAP